MGSHMSSAFCMDQSQNFFPVQELHGAAWAQQHAKPEVIRMGKQCQAGSLSVHLLWPVTG